MTGGEGGRSSASNGVVGARGLRPRGRPIEEEVPTVVHGRRCAGRRAAGARLVGVCAARSRDGDRVTLVMGWISIARRSRRSGSTRSRVRSPARGSRRRTGRRSARSWRRSPAGSGGRVGGDDRLAVRGRGARAGRCRGASGRAGRGERAEGQEEAREDRLGRRPASARAVADRTAARSRGSRPRTSSICGPGCARGICSPISAPSGSSGCTPCSTTTVSASSATCSRASGASGSPG